MKTHSVHGWFGLACVLVASLGAGGCGSSDEDGTDSDTGAATVASTPATLARGYQGTIKDLKVMFRLQVTGTAVTGRYFYVDKTTAGETITLKGTLNGSKLHLDESVGTQKTGSIDATVSDGKISGTWTKPGGATTLPLALGAVPTGKPLPIKRTVAIKKSATCVLNSTYFELFGLTDAKAEDAINQELAILPGCEQLTGPSTTDQTVDLNDSGFFVVATKGRFGGGAHDGIDHTPKNFDVATGKQLKAADIFHAEAAPALRDMVVAVITPTFPAEALPILMITLDEAKLDTFQPEITKDGIRIDLANSVSTAMVSIAPNLVLPWSDLKGLLLPGSKVEELAH